MDYSEPFRQRFHPDHFKDLERSGLSEETILDLGIHSARPHDIPKLIGWNPPEVQSALVFPYPGEEGFCRAKVFPPFEDKDGHTVRYLQRKGSGVRLYIPPLAAKVLNDPGTPLVWTEGEKKAAKACQEEMPCIGLGGLWNWQEDGKPIPKLDDIAHAEREELICPDSDVWGRPDLIRVVYALGKELETRGAKVSVAILTPGRDGKKRGLDDFLVQEGAEAVAKLKRISLRHATFSQAAQWWKGWKQRRGVASEPRPEALQLLERMGHERRLHPAQDFVGGTLFYGIPIEDDLLLVTSRRMLTRADQLPEELRVDNRKFDVCRFSKEGVQRFLGGAIVAGYTLLRMLEHLFVRFIIFRDARLPLLLALWTMGTYCYRVFRVFPYLVLRSPTKRCGKSRLLDLLSLVAFNSSPRTTNPTEAQLFRGPSKNGGTLLLDEVELLRGDKETFQGLLAVLNSGFEKGGVVSRLEKRGDRFEEVSFPTYCPRALAGISRMAETLEDRGILIFMGRKLQSEKVERFSAGRLEAEAQAVRDSCYIWALTHAADVAEVYEDATFRSLEALDDRARDLFEPLLSIALLADVEAQEAGEPGEFAKSLTALAQDLSGVRDEGDTIIPKLIEALESIVETEGRDTFTPTELLRLLTAKDGSLWWLKSPKALAGILNPLGFVARYSKVLIEGRRKSTRQYQLSRDVLQDLRRRYIEPGEQSEETNESGL